ncbi:MAG: hypothetical protein WCI94_07630, partial [Rhodospirillales bacterium]
SHFSWSDYAADPMRAAGSGSPVVRTSSIRADLLRQRVDGSRPAVPDTIVGGMSTLEGTDCACDLATSYWGTGLN